MPELQSLLDKLNSAEGHSTISFSAVQQLLAKTEELFARQEAETESRETWLNFLDLTRKSDFLRALCSDDARRRWTELVFTILQHTNFSMRDLMKQRVTSHPHRILFKDLSLANPVEWTYEQIDRHIREIATVFYRVSKTPPRVAIFADNCLEGACTDLACLCYNIFDTPLSVHFNSEVLLHIFNTLRINIVVSDSKDRLELLMKIRQKTKLKFHIFSINPSLTGGNEILFLPWECKKLAQPDIDRLCKRYSVHRTDEVATTMFTSGSTGLPKGVSFSIYNIVSKRFARATALPEVGDEVFLCYLPLFHTFGRYLELIGSIFWSGTYVFAGNSSAETIFNLFPKVNPTGFISIPLRWQELYDRCQTSISRIENADLRMQAIREIVGHRLRWGLSAAGYLDPRVFRFFNEYGISLCSGFGMTEATGGITMTPPGDYRDHSVGKSLPGIEIRLTANSEMELYGHYVGRYLENAGPGDIIPYPGKEPGKTWLPTGDLFHVTEEGFYQIIDRVKDIYKNNRGQTIAPQVIERKFFKVPGIRNTFLVGDNRPFNVLLIAPDKEDSFYQSITSENLTEYFHQIVMAANADAAPYERVVNFTLIDRDFSQEKGELTSKGSFNRKTIENNFRDVIEALYISNIITITATDLLIRIPRWFFRDLGILETDILLENDRLFDRRNKKHLTVKRLSADSFQVGDLKYIIDGKEIDLGIFARQPRIWTGNPELIRFCPLKEGWDVLPGPISVNPVIIRREYRGEEFSFHRTIRNETLNQVNTLICRASFLEKNDAAAALAELERMFPEVEPHLADVIRVRVEALAYHPEEEIRTLAYRIILLKAPDPEQIPFMPTFIESGLSFLNEKSIREIASSNFGKHRLDALKQRLYWYRTHLKWPAEERNQKQFENVLKMLYNFAVLHLEYYVSIRAELSRWILHKQDPYLSVKAEEYFHKLAKIFEKSVDERALSYPVSVWQSKIMFEYGMQESEKQRILFIFQSTTYLQESVILAFNEREFDLKNIPDNGIWVLRLHSFKEFRHYRLSINTDSEKHYDLHMVLSENPDFKPKPDTFYWLASLAGFPYGPAVAPFLGSSRPNLGILSTQYIGGLTAWDKIREFSEIHKSAGFIKPNAWKKVFIRSFTVIFRAWHHSGFQIVPGIISPMNVVVPEMDFKESAVILSLTGWTEYRNTISLVGPILQDFYCKTAAVYPLCKKQIEVRWIFDACIEALGREEAVKFFEQIRRDLQNTAIRYFDNGNLLDDLERYYEADLKKYYFPLALFSAVDQYAEWYKMNPLTTPDAKEQTIFELLELYKLHEYSDLVRYYFYRCSYFSDATEEIQDAFDRLLEKMITDQRILPIQLIELSTLQSVIRNKDDKNIFSRMVFPRLQDEQKIDLLKIGEKQSEHVIVRFDLTDKKGVHYIQREPLEPREIGQLYQLFFREDYPKDISPSDHHYIVADMNDKIIGGLTWRHLDTGIVLLDGIVVTSFLQGRGIASAMIENFFTSMAGMGIKIVKAHFLFGNYYLKHYFEVDKKWGALVKTLIE